MCVNAWLTYTTKLGTINAHTTCNYQHAHHMHNKQIMHKNNLISMLCIGIQFNHSVGPIYWFWHKQTIILNTLLIEISQQTRYGSATFHPIAGLFPAYILSTNRDHPQVGAMYPLRRNYSSSLTSLGTISQAKPTHSYVYQSIMERRNKNAKVVSSTIELQGSHWRQLD